MCLTLAQYFRTDLDRGVASMALTCDITVKGKYKVEATAPLIRNLLGGDVHGAGYGKVMLGKWFCVYIKFNFAFSYAFCMRVSIQGGISTARNRCCVLVHMVGRASGNETWNFRSNVSRISTMQVTMTCVFIKKSFFFWTLDLYNGIDLY